MAPPPLGRTPRSFAAKEPRVSALTEIAGPKEVVGVTRGPRAAQVPRLAPEANVDGAAVKEAAASATLLVPPTKGKAPAAATLAAFTPHAVITTRPAIGALRPALQERLDPRLKPGQASAQTSRPLGTKREPSTSIGPVIGVEVRPELLGAGATAAS